MAKPELEDPTPLLSPLLEALASGRALRLVAWPGRVLVERADASTRAEIAWTAEQHRRALEAVSAPAVLADGITAAAVGGSIVLRRPPDPMRRVDDLVQDGRLSQLAGRFLSAACSLGRNILVAGPWGAGVELVAALLAEGSRPALVGRAGDAAPAAWPLVADAGALVAFGPDRVGAWSSGPEELVPILSRRTSAAAWIDATRLDQALVRFEAGVEQRFAGATTPLQVLAALDLVVVTNDAGGVRVRQIAEICLAEEGYRPRLLFASGVAPVPSALVPVGAPTFLDELTESGHNVLADELRHAVPGPEPSAPAPPPAPVATPEPEPRAPPTRTEASRAMPTIETPAAPILDPALANAPPPGWELDQLGEEVAADATPSSPESAALAASFGLGPPPPPPGVEPIGPDLVTEAVAGETAPPSFEDAMARARTRDREMAREAEENDSPEG